MHRYNRFASSLALLVLAAVAKPATAAVGPAPVFAVRTFEGRMLKLNELRGRPVVLDFWATWCTPCRASMPHLNDFQDRYKDRGLVVVGLSLDDMPAQSVRRFADRSGFKFRLAMADENVLTLYGPIRSLPTTIFIDRSGTIIRRVVGYIDPETMEAYITELF